MIITDSNIEKVINFIGLSDNGVGHHYLVDLIIERDYVSGEVDKPIYTSMVNTVAQLNEVEPNTLRRGIDNYIKKSVNSLPVTVPTNKRVFLAMLASLPVASLVELLYTLMKNTEVEHYE